MRDIAKLFAGILLAMNLAACSQQAADEPDVAAAPAETAAEFVARFNDELDDYLRELNAAGWLRATYINQDSAIVDALAKTVPSTNSTPVTSSVFGLSSMVSIPSRGSENWKSTPSRAPDTRSCVFAALNAPAPVWM